MKEKDTIDRRTFMKALSVTAVAATATGAGAAWVAREREGITTTAISPPHHHNQQQPNHPFTQ